MRILKELFLEEVSRILFAEVVLLGKRSDLRYCDRGSRLSRSVTDNSIVVVSR